MFLSFLNLHSLHRNLSKFITGFRISVWVTGFFFIYTSFAGLFVFPACPQSVSSFSNATIRDDPFPNDTLLVIEAIHLAGNNVTHDYIIKREIEFAGNDTLSTKHLSRLLRESVRNLQNTSLFNFVDYKVLPGSSSHSRIIEFVFIERWYLWPSPIFSLTSVNLNQWVQNPALHHTNYGLLVVKNNFRGRMERLSFLLQGGYSRSFEFSYFVPYINQSRTAGLNILLGYRQQNRTHYLTQNNQRLFFDPRNGAALSNYFGSVGVTLRRKIHVSQELFFRYDQYHFHDSLAVLNPRFLSQPQSDSPAFFSIQYKIKNDHRDEKFYPLEGYYLDFRMGRYGLGVFSEDNVDLTTFETSLRKFWNIHPRWYFASGLNAKISAGKHQPYYLQQGLGFLGDIVRGYENMVIDGQHFWVAKTNLKYALIPYRVYQMPFLNNQKFSLIHYRIFMNLFVDAGFVYDELFQSGNPYSNTMLGGTGIGIDFVTYYDKVFRTEFSVSRHGNIGVFFHFIAPI